MESYCAILLESYEYVLFCEVDEILYHKTGLRRFIDNFAEPIGRATGYEVVQGKDELPVNSSAPILSQRKWWSKSAMHCDKPLLINQRVSWIYGFHRLKNIEVTPNPDFLLLHLHYADFDLAYARQMQRAKWHMSGDPKRGRGVQHIIYGEDYRQYCAQVQNWNLTLIPQEIRETCII